jgi:hypothetical protein
VSKSAGRALVLLAACALFLAAPAGAAAPTWARARPVVLPSGGTSVPQGYLPGLACAGVGNCVAAGEFQRGSSDVGGLVVAETGGTWHTGRALVAPPGAATPATLTPYAAACAAVGDCIVVGSYDDAAGNSQAFVASEVQGAWRAATEVTLPANALKTGQVAALRAVGCSSATRCVAVGSYTTNTAAGAVEGLVVTGVAGTWSAHEVAAPAGANANPVFGLSQVACAGGACAAAGNYVDDQNATHVLVVDASATPTASVLDPPSNASGFPATTVGALACSAAGRCALDGTYETAGGQLEAYAATSVKSAWAPAQELVMPAGANANPRAFFYGFSAMACHAPGSCTTGGQYVDAQGDYQGFVDNEVAGEWQPATELRLPAGAQQAGHNGGVVAVTCPASGTCRAGAAYLDSQGRYQAYVADEVNDTWSGGTTITLPAGATQVGVDGGVYGLVCRTYDACTATGTYLDAAGNYQGFDTTLG